MPERRTQESAQPEGFRAEGCQTRWHEPQIGVEDVEKRRRDRIGSSQVQWIELQVGSHLDEDGQKHCQFGSTKRSDGNQVDEEAEGEQRHNAGLCLQKRISASIRVGRAKRRQGHRPCCDLPK